MKNKIELEQALRNARATVVIEIPAEPGWRAWWTVLPKQKHVPFRLVLQRFKAQAVSERRWLAPNESEVDTVEEFATIEQTVARLLEIAPIGRIQYAWREEDYPG